MSRPSLADGGILPCPAFSPIHAYLSTGELERLGRQTDRQTDRDQNTAGWLVESSAAAGAEQVLRQVLGRCAGGRSRSRRQSQDSLEVRQTNNVWHANI